MPSTALGLLWGRTPSASPGAQDSASPTANSARMTHFPPGVAAVRGVLDARAAGKGSVRENLRALRESLAPWAERAGMR